MSVLMCKVTGRTLPSPCRGKRKGKPPPATKKMRVESSEEKALRVGDVGLVMFLS